MSHHSVKSDKRYKNVEQEREQKKLEKKKEGRDGESLVD